MYTPQPRRSRLGAALAWTAVSLGAALLLLLLLRPAAPDSPTQAPPSPTPEPLPLSGWTILVDPGHGGYDGGARARDSGVWEKDVNLAVALRVEESLVRRGAAVVMTRRRDEDLCTENRPAALTKKRQDMQARIDLAQSARADVVLSVHMNEYRSRAESGPQVFYRRGSDASRLLAGCLQERLIARLQPPRERTALAGDYFILQLEVPSALVECGFLSNAREEKLLLRADYQALVGEAVAQGVLDYVTLQSRWREDPAQTPPAPAR